MTGGIVIAAIYLFSAFGIGAAVDVREISVDSGLIDAVSLILGGSGGVLVGVVALLFLVTLFGNMISWSMGVNSTAALAADHNDMPRVFAKRWAKNDMPVGAAVTSGVVASCVCVLGVLIEMASPDSSLFWSFFALNLVMLLLSYLPVFPAFLKLRREDAKTPRPFRVPGSDTALKWIAYVPMVLIVISIIFTAVPLSFDAETLAELSAHYDRVDPQRGDRRGARSRCAGKTRAAKYWFHHRGDKVMAKRIIGTTPKQDGYRMPAELSRSRACGCSGPSATTTGATAASPRRRPLRMLPGHRKI